MKSDKQKISFIGPFNSIKPNGADFKNKLIIKYLNLNFTSTKTLNTNYWNRNPLVILKIFKELVFGNSSVYIFSLNTKSAFLIFKIIRWFNLLKDRKLIYFVIGNTLIKGIKESIYDKKYLEIFDQILIEGKVNAKFLNEIGLENAKFFPNFKEVNKIKRNFKKELQPNIKFIFISRVCEEKGVTLILESFKKLEKTNISIDFFGPISEEYHDFFIKEVNLNRQINYCGIIDLFNYKSYEKLMGYDVFLLPTHWVGEGYPGAFIDAFILGAAVVATDWNLNTEILKNNYNSIIIEPKSVDQLSDAMRILIENPKTLIRMKKNSFDSADNFDLDFVFDKYLKL
jgi:glycosyltransferase involved in cell wall biosynthesis